MASSGDRLGIDVDHQYPEFLLVERVTNGGVVDKFNLGNPSQALKQGDHIVRVSAIVELSSYRRRLLVFNSQGNSLISAVTYERWLNGQSVSR